VSFGSFASSWVQSYTKSVNYLTFDSRYLQTSLDDTNAESDDESDSIDSYCREDHVHNIPDLNPCILIHEETTVSEGSSLAQSCFNTVNLLVGVGFLSLPYALKLGGWVIGTSMIVLIAALTRYTGGLIISCMDECSAKSYSDVGEIAFGPVARKYVSAVFLPELFMTCVAFGI
jgi:hypothetical protein